MGQPFTVEFPEPLPVERAGDAWRMEAGGVPLRLTNLDKVFWPEEGFTKGDLLAYYYNVAPTMLPYLKDRPVTMKRMPDGIAGATSTRRTPPTMSPAG